MDYPFLDGVSNVNKHFWCCCRGKKVYSLDEKVSGNSMHASLTHNLSRIEIIIA
jgi:hypothetical protein